MADTSTVHTPIQSPPQYAVPFVAVPPPAPPAPAVNTSGPAAMLDAGGTFLSRLSGFTPQQAQTIIVLLFTLFAFAMVGYLLFEGRRTQAETLAIIIRSMESESEKNRAANTVEFERNRAAFAAEGKSNRDAISDGVKMTVASHQKLSQELGKLEQVVSGLNSTLGELKRKLPPEEEGICPLIPKVTARLGGVSPSLR